MNFVGHELWDDERRANRNAFLKRSLSLQPEQVVVPRVIHGGRVEAVSQHNPIWGSLMCDALITDKQGLALSMCFADCPSVVLYDPMNKVLALVHCGWKPLLHNILENTIDKMVKEFNCATMNIEAQIGPGICGRHYEFKDALSKGFCVAAVQQKDNVMFPVVGQTPHVDLETEIIHRLGKAGCRGQLSFCEEDRCTFHAGGSEKFYSLRRDQRDDPLSTNMCVAVMR